MRSIVVFNCGPTISQKSWVFNCRSAVNYLSAFFTEITRGCTRGEGCTYHDVRCIYDRQQKAGKNTCGRPPASNRLRLEKGEDCWWNKNKRKDIVTKACSLDWWNSCLEICNFFFSFIFCSFTFMLRSTKYKNTE